MTNYTKNESSVRVDFFKPSGKWYATEAVLFDTYTGDIFTALRHAIDASVGERYTGMTAVCLEPHHEHAHPLMIVV
jgi:hypothetical protein